MVNTYCTCGAQLPPDARFCHKCGKPQFESPVPEPEPVQAPIQPPLQPAQNRTAPTGISWRNPFAVRSACIAGAVASLLMLIPLPPILNVLWMFLVLVGGGFWAVHLYRKRTSSDLSMGSGARLGWMTGVFSFLILLIVFTINVILISAIGEFRDALSTALQASGPPEVAQRYEELLTSPAGLASFIFAMLLTCFILLPLFSTIGGALGAKVLEKE